MLEVSPLRNILLDDNLTPKNFSLKPLRKLKNLIETHFSNKNIYSKLLSKIIELCLEFSPNRRIESNQISNSDHLLDDKYILQFLILEQQNIKSNNRITNSLDMLLKDKLGDNELSASAIDNIINGTFKQAIANLKSTTDSSTEDFCKSECISNADAEDNEDALKEVVHANALAVKESACFRNSTFNFSELKKYCDRSFVNNNMYIGYDSGIEVELLDIEDDD